MRVRWLDKAVLDLIGIREYIAANNPRAASQVPTHIRNPVDSLAKHPGIGRLARLAGTCELIIVDFPCIIPYRVKNNVIEVLRVLHAARQWPKQF